MAREIMVVPYNHNWPHQFSEVKRELRHLFGELVVDIQHFGSTAIEGMYAKPIIDVMVIVRDIISVDCLNGAMEAAGYRPRGEDGIAGRRYFVKLGDDGVNHAEHIHCYKAENQHVANELMFRDYVRIDKESMEAYWAVQLEASQKFRFSPLSFVWGGSILSGGLSNDLRYCRGSAVAGIMLSGEC